MSFNFGRRLYTSIWDTAHPLLGRELRNSRMTFFFESPSTGNWFRRFLFNTHVRKTLPPRTRHITKRFASGSFLMLGVSPSPCAVEAGTSCTVGSERFISQSRLLDRRIFRASLYTWKRGLHTSKDDGSKSEHSNDSLGHDKNTSPSRSRETAESGSRSGNLKSKEEHFEAFTSRHIMNRLPHMSHLHRPTKEELLAAANGFWSRLKVRFKWFSIRSVRPFNFDEISALFSWVLLGHVVWIVLGTTTFFSLLIIAINTVLAQGMFQDID
jgi:distribution and morphology protein 31